MKNALLNRYFIDVFQMQSLLHRTYYLNAKETKYVSIYLNDDLKPQVKTGTSSGHAVLNDTQWFILVTFKSEIPKSEVHKLGDSRQTLSMYCGRYVRITSENTQMHLNKRLVTADGFSKCLHRQTSDQIRQTPR
jgi:hypothetical protein